MARTKETSAAKDDDAQNTPKETARVMWELTQAAYQFFQDGVPKVEKLQIREELVPGLKVVTTAAYQGDVAALQAAVDDPAFKAAGGVPKDLLVWMPLPHAKYDGENGATTQKYLSIIRILCSNGAAIKEADLLSECQRFGITEPPHIMSNTSLNAAVSWSCHCGLVPIFRYLRENGASCNVLIGDTCGEGHIDMLRYMLSAQLLPSAEEAQKKGTPAHQIVGEGFSCADMSGKPAVIEFLQKEAGYSRECFPDHGERSEPM